MIASIACPVVQVGLGVVPPLQGDIGEHDSAPGGDRHPERDEEALELADEMTSHKYHVNGAKGHHRAIDQGCDITRDPQAERKQGQPRGVDV